MLDDPKLRDVANEAIESRKLPLYRPLRMWGGPATGEQCSICGTRIMGAALQFDLEFHGDQPGSTISYHAHVPCYGAWERSLDARILAESTAALESLTAEEKAETQRLLFAGSPGTIRSGDASASAGRKRR